MPKAHLTQAFVANAGCEVGKKKTDWYDTIVTGFVLECRCTGGTLKRVVVVARAIRVG